MYLRRQLVWPWAFVAGGIVAAVVIGSLVGWLADSAMGGATLGALVCSLFSILGMWRLVQAVRVAERTYANVGRLIQASPDVIYAKDGNGRWLIANDAAVELLDLRAIAFRGLTDREMNLPAEVVTRCEQTDAAAWEGRRVTRTEENVLHQDSQRTYDVIKVPLFDDDGQRQMLFTIAREITQAKRLEAENAAAGQLATIGQMAGGLAHDFNNVLAAITGYAELIRGKHLDDRRTVELTGRILDAGRHASGVIGQVLSFARDRPAAPEPIDLGRIAEEAADLIAPALGTGVQVHLALGDTVRLVIADRILVEQALINLLLNARDAMPGGGIIDVAVVAVGGRFGITVADRGKGIPPELRHRLFEPFFTTKSKGNGLGLASVARTARMHQGEVSVEDRSGGGTVVALLLPPAPPGSATYRNQRSPRPAKGLHLLLVEDDDAIADWCREVLEEAGHVVRRERCTEDVRLTGDGARVDLLITDLNLPGKDGREVIAAVAKAGLRAPIIIITGFSGDARLDELRNRTDLVIIPKPFRAAQLLDAILKLTGRTSDQLRPAG